MKGLDILVYVSELRFEDDLAVVIWLVATKILAHGIKFHWRDRVKKDLCKVGISQVF